MMTVRALMQHLSACNPEDEVLIDGPTAIKTVTKWSSNAVIISEDIFAYWKGPDAMACENHSGLDSVLFKDHDYD